MLIPPQDLNHPHLDKLAGLSEPFGSAGEEEIERRAQEILNEWQKIFFSGISFQTPANPGTDTRTFEHCEILWGRAIPADPGTLPILHSVLVDRRDGDPVRNGAGIWMVRGEWTWNTFVRTHPQLPASDSAATVPADGAVRSSDRLARRVGDQFAWLLRSPHTQSLALKGIGNMRLLSGPRDIQSGSWCIRQLVFSTSVTFRMIANDP